VIDLLVVGRKKQANAASLCVDHRDDRDGASADCGSMIAFRIGGDAVISFKVATARGNTMILDHEKCMAAYSVAYGHIDPARQQNIERLLSAIEADGAVTDLRWAAYMLATVKHECADRWQPLEEYGKGAGRPYGEPVTVVSADGRPHVNTYYGRGYVQITWKDNYERLGKAIGVNDQLVIFPERALDPSIAYRIMSEGMCRGLFTGRRLGDYINAHRCDYRLARQVIKGLDQAERIAAYSNVLEEILRQSVAAVHGVPAIPATPKTTSAASTPTTPASPATTLAPTTSTTTTATPTTGRVNQ
jgi:hypothetical protein